MVAYLRSVAGDDDSQTHRRAEWSEENLSNGRAGGEAHTFIPFCSVRSIQKTKGGRMKIAISILTLIGCGVFIFIILAIASAEDLASVTAIQQHLDSGGCIEGSDTDEILRLNRRIAFAHGGGVSSWATRPT